VSTCFGTFGELLQGRLPESDRDFLVTLPIARWTTATFQQDSTKRGVETQPSHKRKARRMAEMVIQASGLLTGGVLTIDSNLPEGKGMASSSADLVATARAVANALNVELPPETIERLLGRIEPTDGVLYPGIVAFDHRIVRLRARLGSLPAMTVVGLDEGGTVDTVEFNRRSKPYSAADKREYAQLLSRMTPAVQSRDLGEVGAIATRSAVLNQRIWPKRTLSSVLDAATRIGALGVVNAHSGTVLGLLIDAADPDYAAKTAAAVQACSELARDVSLYRTLTFS
jgi:L-threonine kinase